MSDADDLHAETDREYGPCHAHAHAAELRAVRTYKPEERPDVLLLVDEQWHQGELRQWSQDPQGGWWGYVTWRPEPGQTLHDSFPAERIRPDDTDMGHGRGA